MPWQDWASELGPSGRASWGHLYALRAALSEAAGCELERARRRRATASAGGTIVILSAMALLATSLVAATERGSGLLATVHRAALPGLAFDHARPLLIVATALALATASTAAMLPVLTPRRKAARRPYGLPVPKPGPVRAQRQRALVVVLAGVAPVLIGGGLPFIARLLPIGLRIDASSGVGDSLLDVVVGFAVPATLLGVLCFRWVARLAGAETGESGHG
jgi:hypothetical protein